MPVSHEQAARDPATEGRADDALASVDPEQREAGPDLLRRDVGALTRADDRERVRRERLGAAGGGGDAGLLRLRGAGHAALRAPVQAQRQGEHLRLQRQARLLVGRGRELAREPLALRRNDVQALLDRAQVGLEVLARPGADLLDGLDARLVRLDHGIRLMPDSKRINQALSVSLRGPARKPTAASAASPGVPITGSASTFSSEMRLTRPARAWPASASRAAGMRGSSASTSVCR